MAKERRYAALALTPKDDTSTAPMQWEIYAVDTNRLSAQIEAFDCISHAFEVHPLQAEMYRSLEIIALSNVKRHFGRAWRQWEAAQAKAIADVAVEGA